MSVLPFPVLDALNFEKANRVKGSVLEDPFYQCPSDSSQAAPGTLLKVEKDVDTTTCLIPTGTPLSKIVYQSEKLSGQPIPVPGFILWPYAARTDSEGYQVVALGTWNEWGKRQSRPFELREPMATISCLVPARTPMLCSGRDGLRWARRPNRCI